MVSNGQRSSRASVQGEVVGTRTWTGHLRHIDRMRGRDDLDGSVADARDRLADENGQTTGWRSLRRRLDGDCPNGS